MARSNKEIDDLLDRGIEAMRNHVVTQEQVEEAATRVYKKVKKEHEKLSLSEPLPADEDLAIF
jgi:hypothetical protein